MEALRSSEISVTIYHTTQRNIPEDFHFKNVCNFLLRSRHIYQPMDFFLLELQNISWK
jgi:hypothetical protein